MNYDLDLWYSCLEVEYDKRKMLCLCRGPLLHTDLKEIRKSSVCVILKMSEFSSSQAELELERQEEIKRLEQHYDNTLRSIGQAHTQARITVSNTLLFLVFILAF